MNHISAENWNQDRWPNFALREFQCTHNGSCGMQLRFLDALQLLRSALGFPFIITSGYRNLQHPLETLKLSPGSHALGCAADIGVYGERAYELVQAATSLGMTGIGVMQSGSLAGRYIHLDNAESRPFEPRPMIWSYARQGD